LSEGAFYNNRAYCGEEFFGFKAPAAVWHCMSTQSQNVIRAVLFINLAGILNYRRIWKWGKGLCGQ
jgi:hypothetical protein